jgi:hypothetical protein
VEGDGFETSVPGTKEPVFVAEGELRDRTGAAKKGCFLCGTDGSNPSPSSGESANHRSLKLAAYTHIVRLTNDTIAAPTVPDIAAETRQTYKGPLVIGEDLMTFDIGDGGVAVYRSAP